MVTIDYDILECDRYDSSDAHCGGSQGGQHAAGCGQLDGTVGRAERTRGIARLCCIEPGGIVRPVSRDSVLRRAVLGEQCGDGADCGVSVCQWRRAEHVGISGSAERISIGRAVLDVRCVSASGGVGVEYGINSAASFLRFHEDALRAVAVSARAVQGSTLFGRCSVLHQRERRLIQ